jgi:hypothetical protein
MNTPAVTYEAIREFGKECIDIRTVAGAAP